MKERTEVRPNNQDNDTADNMVKSSDEEYRDFLLSIVDLLKDGLTSVYKDGDYISISHTYDDRRYSWYSTGGTL